MHRLLLIALLALPARGAAGLNLVDLEAASATGSIRSWHAAWARTNVNGLAKLHIATQAGDRWPGLSFQPAGGAWNLAGYARVVATASNAGTDTVKLILKLESPGEKNARAEQSLELKPGAVGVLKVPLKGSPPGHAPVKLFGMRGFPDWAEQEGAFCSSNVTKITVFAAEPSGPRAFTLGAPRAEGERERADLPQPLLPFIDAYGQYMHGDWPGKLKSADDFPRRLAAEAADLAAAPGPAGWDRYGGWADGPRTNATGFFRAEKIGGRWWLVDPEGCLFWSHGIDCVRAETATTPISDRRDWFAGLPAAGDPLAAFYGQDGWAPHNYYEGRRYETFNFSSANLRRKYGDRWVGSFRDRAHQRLRSWGLNTIGNWSDDDVYLLRRTPYVATISAGGRQLEGSEGYWGKFSDVFDPSFEKDLRRHLERERGKSAGDPWCLGYFVGNELSWGKDTSLALAALQSPADQPAKQAFVGDLKARYGDIARLNAAWGATNASWDALLATRMPPAADRAAADLQAFYSAFAERFFRICRDEVKAAAPSNLYLGCRFAWVNDLAVRAAAKYCDVISYNFYRRSIADVRLPEGLDKPVIVGEFHFGALDRGMFHTGLVPTASQDERARAYAEYVGGALRHPQIVGTHWFQYGDQATTGRGDGENYQIGFVDVTDTPYPETIAAARRVAAEMYRTRMGN